MQSKFDSLLLKLLAPTEAACYNKVKELQGQHVVFFPLCIPHKVSLKYYSKQSFSELDFSSVVEDLLNPSRDTHGASLIIFGQSRVFSFSDTLDNYSPILLFLTNYSNVH